MALLLAAPDERAATWAELFAEAGEEIVLGADAVTDPATITHMLCWTPPDFSRWPNLRVVICSGAGVDHFPRFPDGVALCRTLAPGVEEMVRDWVLMATLALHRDLPRYVEQSRAGLWQLQRPRHAATRRVGIMGMGRIGRLAATTLRDLGFPVAGWSRSGHDLDGVESFDGPALPAFLARTDILVCLLPLTEATHGILGRDLFAALPQGAGLVHAGRGAQLDMAAMREALDSGQLATAMLDVTNPEPLPADHWAWSDPRILITPHVAARTPAADGARHALEVIAADRAGRPLPGLVDQSRGY